MNSVNHQIRLAALMALCMQIMDIPSPARSLDAQMANVPR